MELLGVAILATFLVSASLGKEMRRLVPVKDREGKQTPARISNHSKTSFII